MAQEPEKKPVEVAKNLTSDPFQFGYDLVKRIAKEAGKEK